MIDALLERENLALSDLARAMPDPIQRLHGRLKRLDRFLSNPRPDEAALFARWPRLSYRFGDDPPLKEGKAPGGSAPLGHGVFRAVRRPGLDRAVW